MGDGFGGSAADVQCPNNDCGFGTNNPFTCMMSVCGDMSYQYISTHENEWNGQLYSDSEFAQLETNAIEAQKQALTDQIVAATGDDWNTVYAELTYQYTKGGNANFLYSGNPSSFLPGCNGGGEGPECRYDGGPSIHWAGEAFDAQGIPLGAIIHLDAGNPWSFPFGPLMHLGDLLGMINSSVPFGTGGPGP